MDELKNLRTMMKTDTFSKHGFTNKMKDNIVKEINSKELVKTEKNHKFAPILSSIFVAVCISIFAYYGGSELGIMDSHSADSGIEYYTINVEKPSFLSEEYKFPTKVPFEITDVKTSSSDSLLGQIHVVTFIGEKKETLRILFQTFNKSPQNITFTGETVKDGNIVRYYSQHQLLENNNDIKFKTSSMTWLENEHIRYDLHYRPGDSNLMLYKRELLEIARSFR
jgi:hypothetical protein